MLTQTSVDSFEFACGWCNLFVAILQTMCLFQIPCCAAVAWFVQSFARLQKRMFDCIPCCAAAAWFVELVCFCFDNNMFVLHSLLRRRGMVCARCCSCTYRTVRTAPSWCGGSLICDQDNKHHVVTIDCSQLRMVDHYQCFVRLQSNVCLITCVLVL